MADAPAPTGIDPYQSGPADSDLFLRKWSLTLMGANNQSWTLTDSDATRPVSGGTSTIQDAPRMVFQTRQTSTSSRGSLDVTVYTLPQQNLNNLTKLYNRIILRAGYQKGRYGTIFDGTVIYYKQ